ncbi:hypothetical protein TYRP_009080 [Tyrophagus putrescentiae]|nr:hypothetical protein TYRP_009080 [Tyrophagus putrescentiae]
MQFSPIATKSSSEGHVTGHDGHPFGVHGAQVRVLEELHQVGLGGLLQRLQGAQLKAKRLIHLQAIFGNRSNQPLEGRLWQQQPARVLVGAYLAQGEHSGAVARTAAIRRTEGDQGNDDQDDDLLLFSKLKKGGQREHSAGRIKSLHQNLQGKPNLMSERREARHVDRLLVEADSLHRAAVLVRLGEEPAELRLPGRRVAELVDGPVVAGVRNHQRVDHRQVGVFEDLQTGTQILGQRFEAANVDHVRRVEVGVLALKVLAKAALLRRLRRGHRGRGVAEGG